MNDISFTQILLYVIIIALWLHLNAGAFPLQERTLLIATQSNNRPQIRNYLSTYFDVYGPKNALSVFVIKMHTKDTKKHLLVTI